MKSKLKVYISHESFMQAFPRPLGGGRARTRADEDEAWMAELVCVGICN